MGSGPDVFADALVPAAGDRPGFFYFRTSLVRSAPGNGGTGCVSLRRRRRFRRAMWPPDTAARGLAAMVIVVPNATVNRILRLRGKCCGTGTSSIPRRAGLSARLQAVHRDT